MKITIETGSYNNRRYGKPWIAKVDFSDAKGVFAWGDWVGEAGSAGMVMIEAQPGDIIAQGQKDHRAPAHKSLPDWYQVKPDGTLEKLSDKLSAYRAYQTQRNAESPV